MQLRCSLVTSVVALLVILPVAAQSPGPTEGRLLRGHSLPELAQQFTQAACAGARVVSLMGEEREVAVQLEG